MRVTTLVITLGKCILGSVAFLIGQTLGALAASWTGLPQPMLPAGSDPTTLMASSALGYVFLTLILGLIARRLSTEFVARGLALAAFTWIAFGVNNVLEATIFTTYSAASPFTMIMYAGAGLVGGATVAWLFPPISPPESINQRWHSFWAGRSTVQGAWRLLAALASFPAIYLACGALIAPLVIDYYRQEIAGLTLPGMNVIVPMQFLRSALFLLVCLPLLIAWSGSRRRLWLTMGAALFLTVGGIAMVQASWFPATIRLVHSVEILADSFLYAGALVLLLGRPSTAAEPPQPSQAPIRQGTT